MLGNIAKSDSVCQELVCTIRIHEPLLTIIAEANDTQLLYSALGLLKNVALHSSNKVELGDAGIIPVLPRLWAMNTHPQIQYSSISLTRQLLIGNFENVRRINKHLSSDPDSPAYQKDYISLLISVFQRTDAELVKMEIARLLAAICRVFTSPTQNIDDADRRRKKFFDKHPEVGQPIRYMISQNKWPVVRSEGWFVLALMVRTPEGVQYVADVMHDVSVFLSLVELLRWKSIHDGLPIKLDQSPMSEDDLVAGRLCQTAVAFSGLEMDIMRINRENATVLVSELLHSLGPQMGSIWRTMFEDLLGGGGATKLSYHQVKEREEYFDRARMPNPLDHDIRELVADINDEILD
jgi:hypothetical protein